jgi:hypothetical protein
MYDCAKMFCRNGAGRCGTIVLCNAVLRALPITEKIDFYGFTMKLRNFRANMVSDLVRIQHNKYLTLL